MILRKNLYKNIICRARGSTFLETYILTHIRCRKHRRCFIVSSRWTIILPIASTPTILLSSPSGVYHRLEIPRDYLENLSGFAKRCFASYFVHLARTRQNYVLLDTLLSDNVVCMIHSSSNLSQFW